MKSCYTCAHLLHDSDDGGTWITCTSDARNARSRAFSPRIDQEPIALIRLATNCPHYIPLGVNPND